VLTLRRKVGRFPARFASSLRNTMPKWIVYLLVDPRDGEIRYVGCTTAPQRRFRAHVAGARYGTMPKDAWIRELVELGEEPLIELLAGTDNALESIPLEESWIRRLGIAGCDLLVGGSREVLLARGKILPRQTWMKRA
jgi:hypothetical protein